MNHAVARQAKHLEGKKWMNQGQYMEALGIFLTALADHGPHVGLLSDIAGCYYLLGRMEDCQHAAEHLQSELAKAAPLLNEQSLIRTHLYLGKILEELSDVQAALNHYTQAEAAARLEFDLRKKAQAQRLRLQAFLNQKTGLAELYQKTSSAISPHDRTQVEYIHSLMLAEFVLFGATAARARLDEFLQRTESPSWERRLLIIDFLEESMRQGVAVEDSEVLLSLVDMNDCDDFEKSFLQFLKDPDFRLTSADFNRLLRSVPLTGILRLMTLQLRRDPQFEMQRRLLLLLEALPNGSRILLLKKWSPETKNTATTLYFSSETAKVFIMGQQLDVSRKSFSQKCFDVFTTQRKFDIEEFVKRVFDAEYNTSFYDRTRIALSRLNKEVMTLAGTQQLFVITKNSVQIQEGFELKRA